MIGTSTRKDDALDRLSSGITQLTSSDAWRAWLGMQACFHGYSFSNTVLIFVQNPAATRVAAFHMWRRLGRCVRAASSLSGSDSVTRRVISDAPKPTPIRTSGAWQISVLAVSTWLKSMVNPLP